MRTFDRLLLYALSPEFIANFQFRSHKRNTLSSAFSSLDVNQNNYVSTITSFPFYSLQGVGMNSAYNVHSIFAQRATLHQKSWVHPDLFHVLSVEMA